MFCDLVYRVQCTYVNVNRGIIIGKLRLCLLNRDFFAVFCCFLAFCSVHPGGCLPGSSGRVPGFFIKRNKCKDYLTLCQALVYFVLKLKTLSCGVADNCAGFTLNTINCSRLGEQLSSWSVYTGTVILYDPAMR